jgi:hypothetical protein
LRAGRRVLACDEDEVWAHFTALLVREWLEANPI